MQRIGNAPKPYGARDATLQPIGGGCAGCYVHGPLACCELPSPQAAPQPYPMPMHHLAPKTAPARPYSPCGHVPPWRSSKGTVATRSMQLSTRFARFFDGRFSHAESQLAGVVAGVVAGIVRGHNNSVSALAHGLGNDAHPVVTLGEEAACGCRLRAGGVNRRLGPCCRVDGTVRKSGAILAAWRQDG